MLVYLATNKVNGMQYVGLTTMSLGRRKTYHFDAARRGRGSKKTIQEGIRLHGKENFAFERIDTANRLDELQKKECFWIEKLNTLWPNGYNVMAGGQIGGSEFYMKPVKAFGVSYPSLRALHNAHPTLHYCTLSRRIQTGWPVEKAVSTPLLRKRKGRKYPHLEKISEETGIQIGTLESRYDNGKRGKDLIAPLKNAAKSITIKGITFASYREAARHFNVHHSVVTTL